MATSSSVALIDSKALIKKLDLREENRKRIIAGYANVANLEDSQGDIVTLDALQNAWSRWRSNPDFCVLSLLHSNFPLAKVIFGDVIDGNGNLHRSGVDDTGLYIVAEVREDTTVANEAWEKIERGELRGFSIGGRNLSPQLPVCDGEKCVRPITNLELYEVAIVDQPANRVSLFNMLKRDDLAKLADATKQLQEGILEEGFIRVSKKPHPETGQYSVLMRREGEPKTDAERAKTHFKISDEEWGKLPPEKRKEYIGKLPPRGQRATEKAETLFNGTRFSVIYEPVEGEEYVNLFDLALLRPESALTGEALNGGVDSPPLKPEKVDTPTLQGGLSLDKEEMEVKTEQDSSTEDESEPSEAPVEAEVKEGEAEEPAVAPVTMETLMAELALLNERLGNLEAKSVEKVEKAETPSPEPAPAPEPAKPPEAAPEPKTDALPVIQAPAAPPQPEPAPTPEPTKPVLKPIEVKPVEQPKPAPVETPPSGEIETRGVAPPQPSAQQGFDLAGVYKVPWSEIHGATDASNKRK